MSRLCTTLAGIVACCVLMSHSGYAAQSKAGDSAQQATMERDIVRPIEVVKISVDTVGLDLVSKVSISVQCWPKRVKNVTARIVPDSGYEIVSQPQETYSEPDTETVVFTAMIRATARGIWEVGMATSGICSDTTTRTTFLSDFYIQISDTICRAMTFTEYILLQSPFGKTERNPRPDRVIRSGAGPSGRPKPLPGKSDSVLRIPRDKRVIDTVRCVRPRKAAPAPTDSSTKKDSASKKLSGTFDVVGSLSYHDPRDPQGWLRPAKYVWVEVWNDGLSDTPPSADVLLATGTTDEGGCYSFYWLDNSDGDGTADPVIVWRSANAVWEVRRPNGGYVYGWESQLVQNVGDDSTVDFGDHPIVSYPQAMWCFQDISEGWGVAVDAGVYPSFVSCIWPSSSGDRINLLGDTIFISHLSEQAIDVVNHEYGHALMLQPYSNGVIWGCNEKGIDVVECPSTAWREGWATFFPLVVTPDGIMDYDTAGVGEHFTIEIPRSYSFAQGPMVSGRVAGALLDLWDTNNDGLDQNSTNTVTLWTLLTSGVQSHTDSSFCEFWSYLRKNELNAQQIALGLNSIANNTINCPCNSCGDANGDGTIDIADAVFLVPYIFSGGPAPGDCIYAQGLGDANGDGGVDISDAVYLISYIFSGGAAPHCA
ncbi:MAG: dockerin type I repeat-containing protein [candidate division Zixibacteria bacterium]|nr:dockerin type I repeat-containing protein [candidate division Zixibacteria bacterium]